MAQVFTVTASTSVVSINSLTSPNTIVLLSSINNPGKIVGVRDATGDPSIATKPIIISTMSGLQFFDGTSSIVLNQPNGSYSFASQNPTTWQLLNSFGFLTSLSNAFLNELTTNSVYTSFLNTTQANISSASSDILFISRAINQDKGDTFINGFFFVTGVVNLFSTLTANKLISISSALTVGGSASFSTINVNDAIVVGSNLYTSSNFTVEKKLTVDNNLFIRGVVTPEYFSSQSVVAYEMNTNGGMRIAGGISSLSTILPYYGLQVQGSARILSSIFAYYGVANVSDNLNIDGEVKTNTLDVRGAMTIGSNINVQGNLTSVANISSLGNTFVQQSTFVGGNIFVDRGVNNISSFITTNLNIAENVNLSTISANYVNTLGIVSFCNGPLLTSTLEVYGPAIFQKDFQAAFDTQSIVSISSFFSTYSDFSVISTLSIGTQYSIYKNAEIMNSISSIKNLIVSDNVGTLNLYTNGSLYVSGPLYVGRLASASTLSAPIRQDISTLQLSNSLIIDTELRAPILEVNSLPVKINAGSNLVGNSVLNVFGTLYSENTIYQPSTLVNQLWYATNTQVSTLYTNTVLSTMFVGSPSFTKPLINVDGFMLFTQTPNCNILMAKNYVSGDWFYGANSFSLKGYKSVYNGSNLWVAVGNDNTTANSLKYSVNNGRTWSNALSAGFPYKIPPPILESGARYVAYGPGKGYVAVGFPSGTGASIQFSPDGSNWTNGVNNVFNAANGYGLGVAFGSTIFVAVGFDGASFGIKWSLNGLSWQTAMTTDFSFQPSGIAYGQGKWIACGTAGAQGSMMVSADGTSFSNAVYSPTNNQEKIIFVSSQNLWVSVTKTDLGGNSTNCFWRSSDPVNNAWSNGTNGFTKYGIDLTYSEANATYGAVGRQNDGSYTALFSQDAINWVEGNVPSGLTFDGISAGPVIGPEPSTIFTMNVPGRFQTMVSSGTLIASTIQASSMTGAFQGDASLVTNILSFSSNVEVSSFRTRSLNTYTFSSLNYNASYQQVFSTFYFSTIQFLSSSPLYLATGLNAQVVGNIETGSNTRVFSNVATPNFNFFGTGITGNGLSNTPLFVAVGADSRTLYTIQWSSNGSTWNPVQSGGFTTLNSSNYRTAYDVAYGSSNSYKFFVAVGLYSNTTSTIQYSADGSNWFAGFNAFPDYTERVYSGPDKFLYTKGDYIKYSFFNNVSTFVDVPYPPSQALSAIAYGQVNLGTGAFDAWLGIGSTDIYYSTDGTAWTSITPGSFQPMTDIRWNGSLWVGVGSNNIQQSTDGKNWSVTQSLSVDLNRIDYDTINQKWLTTARGDDSLRSIWSASSNGLAFQQLTSGGFSSFVFQLGAGAGILAINKDQTYAVGKGASNTESDVVANVLQLRGIVDSIATNFYTSSILTPANASNVFQTNVRAIAYNSTILTFPFLATGEGNLPSRTIGRSSNATTWQAALVGGFSTTGYALTFYNNKAYATGDAAAPTNKIQFSSDGASWFGAFNPTSSDFLRGSIKGIAASTVTSRGVVLAVGSDVDNPSGDNPARTMGFSYDGLTWSSLGATLAAQNTFGSRANGAYYASNAVTPYWYAVGDSNAYYDKNTVILRATTVPDSVWQLCTFPSGSFTEGYAITQGYQYGSGLESYVAVGASSDPLKTILYSFDGSTWQTIQNGGFLSAGTSVTYEPNTMTWFATGDYNSGSSVYTIQYSRDLCNWYPISSNGFISKQRLGAGYDIFTQPVLTLATYPYFEFSSLVIYKGTDSNYYNSNNIRVNESTITFNDALTVNLSNNVMVNTDTPYSKNMVLTVQGTVYASSLIYRASNYPSNFNVSSLVVSSIYNSLDIYAKSVRTPFLTINGDATTATKISTFQVFTRSIVDLNDAMFVSVHPSTAGVGIGPGLRFSPSNDLQYALKVYGSTLVSTLSTTGSLATTDIVFSDSISPHTYVKSKFLDIEVANVPSNSSKNTITATPSSLVMNSIFNVNLSSQRIGVFTPNPEYTLDVRRNALLDSVSTTKLYADVLFLTLQSV